MNPNASIPASVIKRPSQAVNRGQRESRLLQHLRFMPSILRAASAFAVVLGAAGTFSTGLAQNAFSPGGPDYPVVVPALAGDQVMPDAAITISGGWMVWQDNAVDGDRAGIRGIRLGGDLQAAGAPFRVNGQGIGLQEKPRVALLPNGGAVVVWQGGEAGFQQIYARFFNAAGAAITGDILVNTTTNNTHVTPAVAVNSQGIVLVAWTGFDQVLGGVLDRYGGIFAQRFDASGAKLGGEFGVNTFRSNSQRSPTVTALSDGRFVIGWISELQRSTRSVDVYCRTFNADGSAAGSAFPVNTSTVNGCANPSIAPSPDGGFLVAWSQNSRQFQTQTGGADGVPPEVITPIGWDVFIRQYNANGSAAALPKQLNTFSYGDQFGPRVAAFGRNYLATWVSLAQDGSREGVYGQFFDASGVVEGVEFRVNTTTVSRQLHPALATDGMNRFLVTWSSFQAGSSFDVIARSYDIIRLTLVPEGVNLRLTWNSQPGCVYRIQKSVNGGGWQNVGGEREADEVMESELVPIGTEPEIFRVIRVR